MGLAKSGQCEASPVLMPPIQGIKENVQKGPASSQSGPFWMRSKSGFGGWSYGG